MQIVVNMAIGHYRQSELRATVVLSNKRNRWLINLVMAILVISFLGVGVLLMPFAEVFREQSTSTASPASGANSRQADLAAQARGYELVLQREPDNQTALRALVDLRIQTQDIKGTIAPLEKLAELNPGQTDYTVLLAQAKLQTGDREGAAQAYRGILQTQPGNINALQGLVGLLMQQERPESAVGLLQDTLRSADAANKVQAGSVDVTSVRLLLGQVYAEQKRYPEAIAVYDEATKGDKQDFRPVFAKAMVLQDQGKDEEAKPLFAAAAALAPAQYKDQINQIATGKPPVPPAAAGSSPTDAAGNSKEDAPSGASSDIPNDAPVAPQPSSTPTP